MPVFVTRPEPEAHKWVADLRARGLDAVALPLIEIARAPDPGPLRKAWRKLDGFHAAMFVSANAVREFFGCREPGTRFSIRAWATGPGTAEALRQAGVPEAAIDLPAADAVQFDSEALWERVRDAVPRGARVLIVRGGDAEGRSAGRDWLATQLAEAGCEVETVVAYVRRPPAWTDEQRSQALGAGVWLFSSSEAVANLRQLTPGHAWSQARAVATHPRIAQAARDAGFVRVIESSPRLEELLAALESVG